MNRLSLERQALKNFIPRCCDKNGRKMLLIQCRETWRCALHLSCTVTQPSVSYMYICDELNGSVSLQLSESVSLCFCDGLLKISWRCKPLVKSVDGLCSWSHKCSAEVKSDLVSSQRIVGMFCCWRMRHAVRAVLVRVFRVWPCFHDQDPSSGRIL